MASSTWVFHNRKGKSDPSTTLTLFNSFFIVIVSIVTKMQDCKSCCKRKWIAKESEWLSRRIRQKMIKIAFPTAFFPDYLALFCFTPTVDVQWTYTLTYSLHFSSLACFLIHQINLALFIMNIWICCSFVSWKMLKCTCERISRIQIWQGHAGLTSSYYQLPKALKPDAFFKGTRAKQGSGRVPMEQNNATLITRIDFLRFHFDRCPYCRHV